MDTISVTLNFERELNENEIMELEKKRFIKCKSRGRKGSTSLIFKISYPKFIAENNATLVHSSEVVLICNIAFVNEVRKIRPYEPIGITINRIDIPYTYIMPNHLKFSGYRSVFYRMADTYARVMADKGIDTRSKAIFDFLENKIETLILADNGNTNAYRNKITIYNQYQRFIDTHGSELTRTLIQHPDLSRRIRIEVSKKIDLTRSLMLEDFANLDLYRMYNNSFLDYALTHIFANDKNLIFINERLNKWISIFQNKGSKSYETLIDKYLGYGESYGILREALGYVIENKNTLESAVTSIRKAIADYERRYGVMVIDNDLEYQNIWSKLMSYRI